MESSIKGHVSIAQSREGPQVTDVLNEDAARMFRIPVHQLRQGTPRRVRSSAPNACPGTGGVIQEVAAGLTSASLA